MTNLKADRALAVEVLKQAGLKVEQEVVNFWTDTQLAHAMVWADSVQQGTPIDKPKHLNGSKYYGPSIRESLCGRTVTKVQAVGDGVHLHLDGGAVVRISLEGD